MPSNDEQLVLHQRHPDQWFELVVRAEEPDHDSGEVAHRFLHDDDETCRRLSGRRKQQQPHQLLKGRVSSAQSPLLCSPNKPSWLLFCLWMLALTVDRQARAQTVGVDICACSPSSYGIQLNFSLTCENQNVVGPGLVQSSCVISPLNNSSITDLAPVVVDRIEFLEVDQQFDQIGQQILQGNFTDGQTFVYSSVTQNATMLNATAVPKALQISIEGSNVDGDKIFMVVILAYSNSCDVYPAIAEPSQIGWVVFTSLPPPPPGLCAAYVAPSAAPTMTRAPTKLPQPTIKPTLQQTKTPTMAPILPATAGPSSKSPAKKTAAPATASPSSKSPSHKTAAPVMPATQVSTTRPTMPPKPTTASTSAPSRCIGVKGKGKGSKGSAPGGGDVAPVGIRSKYGPTNIFGRKNPDSTGGYGNECPEESAKSKKSSKKSPKKDSKKDKKSKTKQGSKSGSKQKSFPTKIPSLSPTPPPQLNPTRILTSSIPTLSPSEAGTNGSGDRPSMIPENSSTDPENAEMNSTSTGGTVSGGLGNRSPPPTTTTTTTRDDTATTGGDGDTSSTASTTADSSGVKTMGIVTGTVLGLIGIGLFVIVGLGLASNRQNKNKKNNKSGSYQSRPKLAPVGVGP